MIIKKRVLGLDIVRSIAILLVLSEHSTYVFSMQVQALMHAIFPFYAGVPIFFVLSGFLIGQILLRSAEKQNFQFKDLMQFWIRRWFRTLPNYFLLMIFLLAYDVLLVGTATDFTYRHLFFAQNLVTKNSRFFPEAWSLSIEEWFYFSFPIFCYLGFMIVTDRRNVILILAGFFIVIPVLLRLLALLNEWHDDSWNFIVVYRFDALMYGIIGAYVHLYKPKLWLRLRRPGLFAALFLLLFLHVCNYGFRENLPYYPVYYYCLLSMMTLAALPYFSSVETLKNKKLIIVFTFISTVSFAMYVLNLSLFQWRIIPAFMSVSHLNDLLGNYAPIMTFVLFWPLVIIASYILYRYFEQPIMNLRDRIRIGSNH